MPCNSKTNGRRAKWAAIWESGVLTGEIYGTFDLVVFNIILDLQCIFALGA